MKRIEFTETIGPVGTCREDHVRASYLSFRAAFEGSLKAGTSRHEVLHAVAMLLQYVVGAVGLVEPDRAIEVIEKVANEAKRGIRKGRDGAGGREG